MLEKYAAEDRIEQLTVQKKRALMLDHRQIVEKMISDRIKERQATILQEKQLHLRERELEGYRNEVIEQERRRLLVKHAEGLVGFMPRVN